MQRDVEKPKTKNELGRYVMAGVLLAALSLAMCVTYAADGTIAITPYDPARIIALIALGIVIWKAIYGCRQWHDKRMAVVAAIILSSVLSIGRPIGEANRLAFLALFPLVPTYTISIGKDGLHAFLLALLCLQTFLFVMARHRTIPNGRIYSPLAIAIVSLLVAFTRNNGIFLVVPPLAVLAIATRDRRIIAVTAAVVIASFAWMRVIIPSLGVQSFGSKEALSIPAQIVGANLYE